MSYYLFRSPAFSFQLSIDFLVLYSNAIIPPPDAPDQPTSQPVNHPWCPSTAFNCPTRSPYCTYKPDNPAMHRRTTIDVMTLRNINSVCHIRSLNSPSCRLIPTLPLPLLISQAPLNLVDRRLISGVLPNVITNLDSWSTASTGEFDDNV